MKYCENCGYQTENDQITFCPCCDTPLVVGNQFKIVNQYNVCPKNGPEESVLLKIAFPLIWMIIIIFMIFAIIINKATIRKSVQATPPPRKVINSTTTQRPLAEDVSDTEGYTEEPYDNPEDENTQTQTNAIIYFDDLVEQPDIIFGEENCYWVEVVTSDNDNLRIRTGPTTAYDIIDKMPGGTIVKVVAKSSYNSSWVVVHYNEHYGWACVALNGKVYLREV